MNTPVQTISVTANGRTYPVEHGRSVADFVRERGLEPRMVVVERNGEPLTPSALHSTRLDDGDRLEVVKVVAGG
ncbi:MAG TPA: sulfur carrier protein ThiS [Opitutaceae bacterium]